MRSNRLLRWALLAAVGVLLSLTLAACGGQAGDSQKTGADLAPDFSLNDLNGQRVTLSQFRGKPVMLNFWASWCGPCRIEIPEIQALHQAHGSGDVVILGVDFGEQAATVRTFAQENKLTYRILTDENSTISRLYRVNGIPTTVFLNKQGQIVVTHVGPISQSVAEQSLAKAAQS
jgi:thiol-disulfide isomerase/thioredoxin